MIYGSLGPRQTGDGARGELAGREETRTHRGESGELAEAAASKRGGAPEGLGAVSQPAGEIHRQDTSREEARSRNAR